MSVFEFAQKSVSDISGKFVVKSYQRGYRWGKEEVLRLLDDIYQLKDIDGKNYCLQPIVVKDDVDGKYELIDGQQRLTTLYLIYKYLHNISGGSWFNEPKFSLQYETREESASFLESPDESLAGDNIDFYFISRAYETIKEWFDTKEKPLAMIKIAEYLSSERVKIIWYQVSEDEDAIALFTRLNIGKIPLTSAELVKAMFLSKSSNEDMTPEKQAEIALQWDDIEKELHSNSLWYFLTNSVNNSYQTRIDLVLDLIAGKEQGCREKYATFFYFDKMRSSEGLGQIWGEIVRTFLLLKDWFENHTLYHLIGYLIASNSATLKDIFELSHNKPKDRFIDALKAEIKESVRLDGKNYGELSYENSTDYRSITRLLLLFNVESVRQNGEGTQWLPFEKFKRSDGTNVKWSLEHIHAQQSEGMKTRQEWEEWLRLHVEAVKMLKNENGANDEIIEAMQGLLDNPKRISEESFESVRQRAVSLFSENTGADMHSISNLALLNTADNAALNNSVFAVKRDKIIEMDQEGKFIPFCTRMVFLKYYTPSDKNQIHFWGQDDRIAYIDKMNIILGEYLDEKILIEGGEGNE